jgi:metallo-beta-lactamase class B
MNTPSCHVLSRLLCASALLMLGAACASSGAPLPSEIPEEYGLAEDVRVRRLAPGVWVHTTLAGKELNHYPANGLLIIQHESSLLVDTAWNSRQADLLMDWAQQRLNRPVRGAVVTHFHNDRAGGVDAVLARGLPVYGLQETARLATARGAPVPLHTFASARAVSNVELFFPGPGHSPDNLVVWHRDSGVLFGGCFVKDASARALGNVADADLAAWPASLERTRAQFPEARIVVPGHGLPGGPELLTHTQALLRARAPAP